MATETKKSKAETAPKTDTAPKKDAAAKTETAPKTDTATKAESPAAKDASKSADSATPAAGSETTGGAPANYSRGEGQKPVTAAYRENWNAIFGKKKTNKKKR